ncbi:MAG: FAD-dependent monooxygenase [Saprospiraceae bacterium]|nr:FAD-dependent monooxygenase [Saprospiraceae bacterium]
MSTEKSGFAIVGGGVAGLAMAIALQQKGYRAPIFEATPDMQPAGAGLVLAVNAIKSLQKLGIADEVKAVAWEMPAFKVLSQSGSSISDMENDLLMKTFGLNNIAIHRTALHRVLRSQIDENQIHTGKKVVDYSEKHNGVEIIFEDGSTHFSEYLIVADGVNSCLRQKLVPGSTPRYAGYTCWRAIAEQPESLSLDHGFECSGSKGRFGATPLAGNQLYWFACVNAPRKDESKKHWKTKELLEIFKGYFAPIELILKNTKDEDVILNDIADIAPIPRFAFRNILLAGDAAHATTPNMAQGACQALEDAAVLSHLLENNSDIPAAFLEFEKRRIPRTHFIVNTSRIMGKIFQMENPIAIAFRNALFRSIPASVSIKQLQKIYAVDFN